MLGRRVGGLRRKVSVIKCWGLRFGGCAFSNLGGWGLRQTRDSCLGVHEVSDCLGVHEVSDGGCTSDFVLLMGRWIKGLRARYPCHGSKE